MVTINCYRRSQYGNERVFPTGTEGDAVKTLTRRGTLTPEDIEALSILGVTIKHLPELERVGVRMDQ